MESTHGTKAGANLTRPRLSVRSSRSTSGNSASTADPPQAALEYPDERDPSRRRLPQAADYRGARGWRLMAAEVFVVSPEARLDARGFSLINRTPPRALLPFRCRRRSRPGFIPPAGSPRRQRRAAPRRQRASLLERAQARLNELSSLSPVSPPVDPELVAALKQLPTELTAMLKPLVTSPKPAARGPSLRLRAQRDSRGKSGKAVIAAWCDEKRYRQGVPKSVTTQAVWRMMKTPTRWIAVCAKLGFDPKEVQPPETWHTVDAWIGR